MEPSLSDGGGHPDSSKLPRKYSGENSLSPDAEAATALVSTVYADARLWPGAEVVFNPELSGGKGLSRTLGVGAFPSGLVYRVGDPAPVCGFCLHSEPRLRCPLLPRQRRQPVRTERGSARRDD